MYAADTATPLLSATCLSVAFSKISSALDAYFSVCISFIRHPFNTAYAYISFTNCESVLSIVSLRTETAALYISLILANISYNAWSITSSVSTAPAANKASAFTALASPSCAAFPAFSKHSAYIASLVS